MAIVLPQRSIDRATGTVTVPLSWDQIEAIWANAQATGLFGGRGSGKTFAGANWCLRHNKEREKRTGLVVAPTYRMLEDSTLPAFLQAFHPVVQERHVKKSSMSVRAFNGWRWLFRSGDEPDKMRSLNISACWADEAALMRKYVHQVIVGCLREKGDIGNLFVTTTPRGRRHWTYKTFGQGKWDGRRCSTTHKGEQTAWMIRVSSRDNPFLSPEFVEMLEREYTGVYAEQELEGRFVAFEGAAFPIDEEKHVRRAEYMPGYEAFQDLWVGIDDGWTNPRAAGLWGRTAQDQIYGIREFYASRSKDDDFVAEMKRWQEHTGGRISGMYVDPHSPRLINALDDAGLPAMRGTEKRVDSIRYLVSLFQGSLDGQPKVVLSESMVNHISELTSAVYVGARSAQTGETKWAEDIVKVNDHAIDAMRYALFTVSDVGSAFCV